MEQEVGIADVPKMHLWTRQRYLIPTENAPQRPLTETSGGDKQEKEMSGELILSCSVHFIYTQTDKTLLNQGSLD